MKGQQHNSTTSYKSLLQAGAGGGRRGAVVGHGEAHRGSLHRGALDVGDRKDVFEGERGAGGDAREISREDWLLEQ